MCSVQSHIASFYDIAHLWTIDCVLFLDIHMQICVPPNIDLFCGLVLIFLCGLISHSGNTDYLIIASDKSMSIFVCIKIVLALIQLLLRQYGLIKTSSGPKFDYS